MSLSATDLINNFEMYFDGTDMTNASLYLCIDSAVGDSGAQAIIEAMRAGGLWSADIAKVVPAEHKPMIRKITGSNVSDVVSFGTDAGYFERVGISTVVFGPGSIEQAHKPDEYIEISELERCLAFLHDLAKHQAQ